MKDASSTILETGGGDEREQGERSGPMPALGRSVSAKTQPFEFKVLEVCLEHTCKCMESEVYYCGQAMCYATKRKLICQMDGLIHDDTCCYQLTMGFLGTN